MFDIGFLELIVIGALGLFVIGPERLPGTIKTCALWIGRVRRSLAETRREIESQLGAEEIRRQLHNEEILKNLEKMKETRAELENKLKQWESGEVLEHDNEGQHEAHHDPHESETEDEAPARNYHTEAMHRLPPELEMPPEAAQTNQSQEASSQEGHTQQESPQSEPPLEDHSNTAKPQEHLAEPDTQSTPQHSSDKS